MAKKKKNKSKVRANFRKRQNTRVRKTDFTKDFKDDAEGLENSVSGERLSGKGNLSRKRTVIGTTTDQTESGFEVSLDIDSQHSFPGRVLSVHGLNSFVKIDDGQVYECTVRGVLKSLATDLQHVVVAGDFVTIEIDPDAEENWGVIVRVNPRRNQISRTSRKRQQIIAANIDLAFIVSSAVQPALKPNLIDRFLVSAQKSDIQAVIVINKIDQVNIVDLQPLAGVWSQLGYPVVMTSAITGQGIGQLRNLVVGRDCVVAGQSGVGKSSILNAIEPGLALKVSNVSQENQKGRHTTTAARLIPLKGNLSTSTSFNSDGENNDGENNGAKNGGHLIDTPGIRSFQLWDVIPEEVAGYFPEIRPFINFCRFPDCTHTHEEDCSVKWAVADGKIDARRYESYCQMRINDEYL